MVECVEWMAADGIRTVQRSKVIVMSLINDNNDKKNNKQHKNQYYSFSLTSFYCMAFSLLSFQVWAPNFLQSVVRNIESKNDVDVDITFTSGVVEMRIKKKKLRQQMYIIYWWKRAKEIMFFFFTYLFSFFICFFWCCYCCCYCCFGI